MSVVIESTLLNDVLVLQVQRHHDSRGFFEELGREGELAKMGIPPFLQTNHSRSTRNVVRGLHAQPNMGKLLFVLTGTIQLVELDIRPSSPMFGKHASIILSDADAHGVWIPPGHANGFCTISDSADVLYQCTTNYDNEMQVRIHPLDSVLAITWMTNAPVISEQDATAPSWLDGLDRLGK